MFGIDSHMWNSALKQAEFLNLLCFQTRRYQNCHFACHVVSWSSETVGLGVKTVCYLATTTSGCIFQERYFRGPDCFKDSLLLLQEFGGSSGWLMTTFPQKLYGSWQIFINSNFMLFSWKGLFQSVGDIRGCRVPTCSRVFLCLNVRILTPDQSGYLGTRTLIQRFKPLH